MMWTCWWQSVRWLCCACCYPSSIMNCRCIGNSAVFVISFSASCSQIFILLLWAEGFVSLIRFHAGRVDLRCRASPAWQATVLFWKDFTKTLCLMWLGANTIINWTTVKSNSAFVAVAVAGLLAYLVSGSPVDRTLSSHMEKTNRQRANTERTDSGHNPVPPSLTALSPVLGSWRAISSLTVKNKTHFSSFYELDTLWLLLI